MTAVHVLDTAALLSRSVNLLSGENITTDSVLNEISMGRLAAQIGSLREIISTRTPDRDHIERVRSAAAASGDLRSLSETDIEIVALALQVNGILLSDDYSVLNLCISLGIRAETVEKPGISRTIKWIYRCTGCGRTIESRVCPVCGHEGKRYSAKTEKGH